MWGGRLWPRPDGEAVNRPAALSLAVAPAITLPGVMSVVVAIAVELEHPGFSLPHPLLLI